jgi:hypothetical protein
LGAAALGAAGAAVGFGAAPASAHGTLAGHNEINSVPIYYVGSGEPGTNRTEYFNPTFYSRLETWLGFYYLNVPIPWIGPMRVNHLGVHDDDDSTSMHYYGRAIDLSRYIFTDANTQTTFTGFDCRYNIWSGYTGSLLITTRKRYWAAVAGLNYHFKYVLHYFYNAEHHNHVHVDNEASGSGNSTFTTGSSSQVYSVQAACRYIWGYSSIAIDGIWGPQTDSYSRQALTRIGRSGGLTTSQTNWLEFNKATLRFGTGRQAY